MSEQSASCIRITEEDDGTPYYVSAVFREEDGQECFDLTVTDLKRSWSSTGLRRPPTSKAFVEEWMSVAREALTGVPNASLNTTKKYTWQLADKDGKLKLGWMFRMARLGQGEKTYKGAIEVDAAPDARAIIEQLVSRLVADARAFKDAFHSMQHTAEGFRQETKFAQDALEKEVANKEKREEELYIKFAAVLNESKKKCREWQTRAEQAEEQLEKGEATEDSESTAPTQVSDAGSGDEAETIAGAPPLPPEAAGDAAATAADTVPLAASPPAVPLLPEEEPMEEVKEPTPVAPRQRHAAPKKRRVAKKLPKGTELAGLDAMLSQH